MALAFQRSTAGALSKMNSFTHNAAVVGTGVPVGLGQAGADRLRVGGGAVAADAGAASQQRFQGRRCNRRRFDLPGAAWCR